MVYRTEEECVDFINQHKWIVKYILDSQFSHAKSEFEDLMQEGLLSLYQCVLRYDETLGNKFETFAFPSVRGAILKYFRDKGLIKIPRELVECATQIRRIANDKHISFEDIRLTDITEVNYDTKTKLETLEYMALGDLKMPLLNEDEYDDEKSSFGIFQLEDETQDPEGIAIYNYTLNAVCTYIESHYKGRTRDAIEEYFYTLYYEGIELTQQYLADKYGMSQMTISRNFSKIRRELQAELN